MSASRPFCIWIDLQQPQITYWPGTVLAATPTLSYSRDRSRSREPRLACQPEADLHPSRHLTFGEARDEATEAGRRQEQAPDPGSRSVDHFGRFFRRQEQGCKRQARRHSPVVFCRSLTGRRTSSLAESRDSPPSARHGAYLVLTSKTTFSAAWRRDTTRAAIEDKDMLASLRRALLGKRPFPSSRDREQQFSSSSAQQVSFSVASRVRSVRLRSGLRSDMRDCFRLVQYDPSARFDRTYVTGRSWLKLFSRIR